MGLLSQALKNFFPLNKGDNDFTSSCKIPYFNASNNPYGCVSPSKLASVLGVDSAKMDNGSSKTFSSAKIGGYLIYVFPTNGIPNLVKIPYWGAFTKMFDMLGNEVSEAPARYITVVRATDASDFITITATGGTCYAKLLSIVA